MRDASGHVICGARGSSLAEFDGDGGTRTAVALFEWPQHHLVAPSDRQLHGGGTPPAEAAAGIPVGHLGDADDFGAVVAFLCSQQARFVTGTSLLVDGGAFPGLV